MGVAHVRNPLAHRGVDRVLEGAAAGFDRDDLGAEELHPLYVRTLARNIDGAHEDTTRKPKESTGGRGGDAVLSRTRLRNDPPLAESSRKQRLADRVVDLVRARVIEILALEEEARPPS